LACLEELLRPAVIEALGDTLTAAKAGDALLAAQARQDDPDLLLRGIVLPGLPLDPTDQPVGRVLRCSGCLVHLRSMVASMNQKSSVTQTLKSVRRVLTSDNVAAVAAGSARSLKPTTAARRPATRLRAATA